MIENLIAIAIAFAVAAVVPQAQTAVPASKPVPRAANGRPDLSGIWIANGALRLMAGDEEVKRIQQADAAAGRKPLPPTEPPPYKPEAEARRQEYLARRGIDDPMARCQDRKSTRLNSSHLVTSYAVFCLNT